MLTRDNPVEVNSIEELFAISSKTELAFIKVSSDMAQLIMEVCNLHNRPLSVTTVQNYITEMKANRWVDAVTSLSFNRTQELIDGQHRLSAVQKSGMAQVFMVNFNQPDNAFQVIDSGKKRNPSDTLALEGYKNKTTLSAMARKYNHYVVRKGNMWNIGTPCNNQQTLALVRENPLMVEAAQYVDSVRDIKYLGNKSDIGTIYFILKTLDPEKADIFMNDFLVTEKETMYDGIDYRPLMVATRKKLMNNRSGSGKVLNGNKRDPHDAESRTYWYIFDAWNLFISGSAKIPSFKTTRNKDESFPRIQSFFVKE